MAEFPAMPLWTDAYMVDTLDLTDAQHGSYFILLMIAWRREDCALPNDMDWLHRAVSSMAARTHRNHFNSVVPPLLQRFFTLCEDGKWRQKRLSKEREYVRNRSRIQKELADKRWAKERGNNGIADANAYAPTPIPTPTPKERGRGAVAPSSKSFLPEDWSLPSEWLEAARKAREEAGLSALDWQAEAARFKAHWLHPDSKNRKKSDWRRTWLKWCMSAYAKPAEQSKPRAGSGTQYEAPTHNPDVAWRIKAETYAKNLAMNIPLSTSASDQDIRRMVKEGLITRELAEQRGYNLWRAA